MRHALAAGVVIWCLLEIGLDEPATNMTLAGAFVMHGLVVGGISACEYFASIFKKPRP